MHKVLIEGLVRWSCTVFQNLSNQCLVGCSSVDVWKFLVISLHQKVFCQRLLQCVSQQIVFLKSASLCMSAWQFICLLRMLIWQLCRVWCGKQYGAQEKDISRWGSDRREEKVRRWSSDRRFSRAIRCCGCFFNQFMNCSFLGGYNA